MIELKTNLEKNDDLTQKKKMTLMMRPAVGTRVEVSKTKIIFYGGTFNTSSL
jgi:hypothetical protein